MAWMQFFRGSSQGIEKSITISGSRWVIFFSVAFFVAVMSIAYTAYSFYDQQQRMFFDQNKQFHGDLYSWQEAQEQNIRRWLAVFSHPIFIEKFTQKKWEAERAELSALLKIGVSGFQSINLVDISKMPAADQTDVNFAVIHLAKRSIEINQIIFEAQVKDKVPILKIAKPIEGTRLALVLSLDMLGYFNFPSKWIGSHYFEIKQQLQSDQLILLLSGKKLNDALILATAFNGGNWFLSSRVKAELPSLSLMLVLLVMAMLVILSMFFLAVFSGNKKDKIIFDEQMSSSCDEHSKPSKKLDKLNVKNDNVPSKVAVKNKPEKPSGKAVKVQAPTIEKGFSMSADRAAFLFNEIFRAYDIRGIVGKSLTVELVESLGRSLGTQALAEGDKTLIVARDGRLSGPELQAALMRGINHTGCHVIDIGMVPTPVLYFATNILESKSGVMVTGSHNPPEYNGFKMVIQGQTLAEQDIQNLKNRIANQDYCSGVGTLHVDETILERYVDKIVSDTVLSKALKIVIDCGNGVTGVIATRLFESIGAEVIPLFTDVDGNFPNHHPDPSKVSNLKTLIATVKKEKADIGLAFDGDGDRLGVVTPEGKIIYPDRLMMLLAEDLLSRIPGSDIIFDIKCTRDLSDHILKLGGRPIMWKTGHSLIKAKLKETKAILAGEMSGHIFYNDSRWYGFDDALYTAVRLLEILSFESDTADKVFARFPEKISTPEINIPVTEESKFKIVDSLKIKLATAAGTITTIDGIRIDTEQGWGLIRASNTTPNLVARFEADNRAYLETIKALFKDALLSVDSTIQVLF